MHAFGCCRQPQQADARLIAAACDYLASDVGTAASVQQLAARADVGVGVRIKEVDAPGYARLLAVPPPPAE